MSIFSKRRKSLDPAVVLNPNFQVLKVKADYTAATEEILSLGLSGHHDPQKNWDLWLSINSAQALSKKSNLLDAGSGSKAVFANSMAKLGYKNSYACDLQRAKGKKIVSSIQDISKTNYDSGFFDFVACHSVIEHGVNLENFLGEMHRITKVGGVLAVSTDFWPTYEDHSGKFPYGEENPSMKLFNNVSIDEFLKIAEYLGWEAPMFEGIDTFDPRPIYWQRMNSSFTFIWMRLVKK
jgi:2-polyprenyl-3-methyl-5-hydroxy-6-metoxy-1,4-benzoquinol methylase